MTAVTRKLACLVFETPTHDLPDDAFHEATRCFMNLIGAALFASQNNSMGIWLELFREEGGNPRATIIGSPTRTSMRNAALANGYLGHFEDYDDTHFPTIIHGSAPIFPAALAVAEERRLSGRDLLAAFILGYEVAVRIGLAVHPSHYDRGWHVTGTVGNIGAAAAAGRLLDLNLQQMVHSLGIAGTQSSGLRQVMGSMAKPFHPGHAAETGLLSALLASKGFTSNEEILEGQDGFFRAFADQSDSSKITEGLGERWEIRNNGLKPYACGVVNHPVIDALIQLKSEGLLERTVAEIQLRVHPLVRTLVDRRDPKVGLEGKFSIYHCAAVALLDGGVYPAQFTDDKVNDPIVRNLGSRIHLVVDASLGEDAATVHVQLTDGNFLDRHVEHAAGTPNNPMTDAQVEAKFRTLAAAVFSSKQIDQLVLMLWELPELDDLSLLTRLLGTQILP